MRRASPVAERMSPVKLLYAPETSGVAQRIAVALEAEGYPARLGDEGAAGAAVVIWSPAAGSTPSILQSARLALSRRVLVPVALGKASPPPSFEHLWPMDLSGWNGETGDPRWRFVLDEIELAVRRGVELGAPVERPAPPPDAGEQKTKAPRAADDELEDIFADPITYRVASPPRPRIPFAALVAGFAALGVASAGAFLAGRQTTHADIAAAESIATGQARAALQPKDAGFASAPPVVAFVQPADEAVPEITSPVESDLAALSNVEAPAGETDDHVSASTDLREGSQIAALDVAPLTTAPTPAPTPTVTPAAEQGGLEAQMAALVATNSASSVETPVAPEQGEIGDDEDPIAGLAFNAVADQSPERETVAFGRYFRDCVDCPDMAEIASGGVSPFAMGVREVTIAQWDACVEAGACNQIQAGPQGAGALPMSRVSYADALSYVGWLSRKAGIAYRLPSEAEWDVAAGSKGAAVTSGIANIAGGRAVRLQPALVGSYKPNAFGLYDVFGNVWEWTMACSAAPGAEDPCSERVLKGGAFDTAPATLAAVDRSSAPAMARRGNVGFRVARDLH